MNFKKILLAVDASDNAMRAVEYVGDIAGDCAGFSVELLCIERLPHRDLYPDEEAWKKACEATRTELRKFLNRARDHLVGMGVSLDRLTEQYVTSCASPFDEPGPACSQGTGTAQEILNALDAGGFGTVVVGRRGVSKAEEFLFGSVSNKIIHSVKNSTVWVVA
ncbi:universal stress protein [Pseudodesulfovibrio portus]|uniref:UspA domain-containing protein n=1 Tax=Pseudodesulfovibrio portus TaxID=231439 RepID=A0ABM8AUH7_9BACT|nr:universal stress protein [Pseudodesulfovibrio portus]BDQ35080.1 hypothetical protein JCM14722_26220 [Pseudodesulfovibrio portus]